MPFGLGTLYVDGKPMQWIKGQLGSALPYLSHRVRVSVDTETNGLFVDGDWHSQPNKCQPPARVSALSLAWIVGPDDCRQTACMAQGEHLHSLAIPFDQGRVSGKPGLWDQTTETFKRIKPLCVAQFKPSKLKPDGICNREHDARCHTTNKSKHDYVPGPEPEYNFTYDDWCVLLGWLIGRPLVFHNSKFDCHMCRAGLREELISEAYPGATLKPQYVDLMPYTVWDTQTVNGILDPLQKTSLKPTAKRLWGEQEGDEQAALMAALKLNGVGLTKRYDLVDWHITGPYAAKDAEQTIRLAHNQWRRIAEGEVESTDLDIIKNEFKLTALLYRMEIKGIPFRAQAMREQAKHMHAQVAQLEAKLPFSPPTITGAKTWFFDTLGLPPVKTTEQGEASLDAEVVARLVSDGIEGAETWERIANLNSALSKWYDRWPYLVGSDGRLRTNFRQMKVESDRNDKTSGGAVSGRLSAERVQTQGVPHEWKLPPDITGVKEFVGEDDSELEWWELDISNAEIRVAAWLSRCKALADRINTGANIHDENTNAIFGINPDHPEWDKYRLVAKTGVFSDIYGSGLYTMQTQIQKALKVREFPVEQVKQFKAGLNQAYPELKRTAWAVQRKADKTQGGCGYVRLVNGRKRVFGWGERLHKAFNACIQGGVAEVMKEWMLAIDEKYPNILINQVHDSVWIEISKGASHCVEDIQRMGKEIFEKRFSTPDIPITFKIDAKRIS